MISALTAGDVIVAGRYRGDHMDDADWMWVFGPVVMTAWLALLALAVWWIVATVNRRQGAGGDRGGADSAAPEEILARRYARGEIGTAEYREALEHLRSRHRDKPS